VAVVPGQDGRAPDKMKVSPAMPMNSASNLASARLGTRLYAFTETARSSVQAMILDVYRNFLNSKIGAAEAEKAQVLGAGRVGETSGNSGVTC
jgi:hypothetical protein